MMDRGRTEREYNGHTRRSSLMHTVLLMTLSIALSSGYIAIPRYNTKAALNSRYYMEAQLSSKATHRSFYKIVNSGRSPAINLIRQSLQEDCDRLREGLDEMMDGEKTEEGEDGELKAEASFLEESMGAKEDVAIEEDVAVEENMVTEREIRRERYLYYALGNKEYVIRGEGVSEDSGVIDDDVAGAPVVDSPTIIDTMLTAQPLKSLVVVHIWVVSSGYSFPPIADIAFDGRDGSVMVIRKSYRSSGGDGPGVKAHLNGNGIYCYYEDS